MKKILLLSLIASFALCDKTYELRASNMGCENCAKKIEKAASGVGGFKNISFDLKSKDINLTISDGANINDFIEAIRAIKYKAELKK